MIFLSTGGVIPTPMARIATTKHENASRTGILPVDRRDACPTELIAITAFS